MELLPALLVDPGATWLGGPAVGGRGCAPRSPPSVSPQACDSHSNWVPKLCPVGKEHLGNCCSHSWSCFLLLEGSGRTAPSTGSRLSSRRHLERASCLARCFTASSVALSFPSFASTLRPYFLPACLCFLHLLNLYSEVSIRRAAPSRLLHVLICSALPSLQTPTVVSDQLPWLQPCSPASIARMPPWKPHAHRRLCA